MPNPDRLGENIPAHAKQEYSRTVRTVRNASLAALVLVAGRYVATHLPTQSTASFCSPIVGKLGNPNISPTTYIDSPAYASPVPNTHQQFDARVCDTPIGKDILVYGRDRGHDTKVVGEIRGGYEAAWGKDGYSLAAAREVGKGAYEVDMYDTRLGLDFTARSLLLPYKPTIAWNPLFPEELGIFHSKEEIQWDLKKEPPETLLSLGLMSNESPKYPERIVYNEVYTDAGADTRTFIVINGKVQKVLYNADGVFWAPNGSNFAYFSSCLPEGSLSQVHILDTNNNHIADGYTGIGPITVWWNADSSGLYIKTEDQHTTYLAAP